MGAKETHKKINLKQPLRICLPSKLLPPMSSELRSQRQSRAGGYRELAMQAINSVTDYRARAEQNTTQGQAEIAAEYQQLANEAVARAERYLILADFAERKCPRTTKGRMNRIRQRSPKGYQPDEFIATPTQVPVGTPNSRSA